MTDRLVAQRQLVTLTDVRKSEEESAQRMVIAANDIEVSSKSV